MHQLHQAGQSPRPNPTTRSLAWQSILKELMVSSRQLSDKRPRTTYRRRQIWLMFLAYSALALAFLCSAWLTASQDQWFWFWVGILGSAALSVWLLTMRTSVRHERTLAGVARLRTAAIAGDTSLAPKARVQPSPLGDAALSHGPITLRPLYYPEMLFELNQTFLAVMWLIVGVMQLTSNLPLNSWQVLFRWQYMLSSVVFFALGLVVGGRTVRLRRPFAVVADVHGLAWRRWGKRHVLPWAEVRALCRIDTPRWYLGVPRPPWPMYLIEGSNSTLQWTSWARVRGPDPASTTTSAEGTAVDDPSWLLCRLVATKTGCRLRDLTPAITDLVDAWATRAGPRATQSPRARRRGMTWRFIRTLAPSLAAASLVVALALVGSRALVLQPRLYAGQLAEARAGAPLLLDPLTKETGLWPVGSGPTGVFSYTKSGYMLTPTSGSARCGAFAWAPPRFADATVAVTVRQDSTFSLSETGLIVRADGATHTLLVFAVTPSGEWHLDRYRVGTSEATIMDDSLRHEGSILPVDAIHQGLHATNRLAVMMRGSSYAFFINGQFVGIYRGDGPASGHVGMYVDCISQRAIFADFAVYRTPPPPPLILV